MNAVEIAVGIQRRIACQDYEALFTCGGCFHFALRLQALTGGEIHGIPTNDTANKEVGHVWCVVDKAGRRWGVDIRGMYPEDVLADWALNWPKKPEIKPRTVDLSEVTAQIAAKALPSGLDEQMYGLADLIIQTHERFRELRGGELSAAQKAELGSVE